MWTESQRRVLAVLVLLAAGGALLRAWFNPTYVPSPQPTVGALADRLEDRVDPNTATWQTLATLPNIGEHRAKEIVDYRDRFAREHPGRPAFSEPKDLLGIRGLGVVIVSDLRNHLMFSPAGADSPEGGPEALPAAHRATTRPGRNIP